MKPVKKKRDTSSPIPNTFKLQAEALAEQYVTNKLIIKHIKSENEKIAEQLMEAMLFRGIDRELEVIVSQNQKEYPFILRERFKIQLITRRETIPNIIGSLKVLIKSAFKKYLPNVTEEQRKKFTNALATTMATFLRKDAVLISALKTTKWGAKYIEQVDSKPYFLVTDKEGKEE